MAEKLNDRNYAIWARKMSLALDGRGRLKHITATPLKSGDPKFIKWRQADSTVITWILENIESDIVNQYIDYPTAWDLWKGIEATYGSGKDPLQEIDRRRPNPMKCPEDMTIFTQIQQQNRLYQFLQAINEEFDVEKRDILKTDPLPSVEEAYAQIRREATRKGITKGDDGPSSGDVLSDWWPDSQKRGKKQPGVARAVVGNQETTSTTAVQASENFAGIAMGNVEEESSGVRRRGEEVTGYSDGEDHWAWF
ncbi:unnamed protein product [Cuscuta campestris]|uniref:Retrotransposon Copia-like N-terminal domain-containing protein n=1 Tax=Cuscuta campestris TaxID=132261 RepID=A0A484LXY2_9ASTE|nr:unnamed protein product [Cuscuta campestris]